MDAKRKNKPYEKLTAKDFLYKRKGPWPQPSPAHPFGESPAVLHLPLIEKVDWWAFIGSRYMATLAYTPIAFLRGLFKPGLEPVSDEKFNWFLTDTMLAKFLHDKFDSKDNEIFKEYLKESADWFIVDLEPIKVVKTFKGLYASGTKTLLKKTGEPFQYEVVCIYVDKTNEIFEPNDGDAWELAKYFVLQGGAMCATLVVHPLLHFPVDCINAITKTAIPMQHPIFKILKPHLRFTLPLENAVLTYKSSLLQSKWWMPYAPYPGEKEGLRELLVEGYKGIKGNVSYEPFSFPMSPPEIPAKYGILLKKYFDVIYRFVEEVLKDLPSDDFYAKKWGKYIAHQIPGFPGEEKIMEGDNLVRCVAMYLWDITVAHSVDHYNYGSLNKRQIPLRIRQEPPTKGIKMKKRKKLCNPVDLMKYFMADILFFSATNVTTLITSEYDFNEPYQIDAVRKFKEELKKIDKELNEENARYIPLDEIAASIQY